MQGAIDAAVNGDIIVVAPGLYAERLSLQGKKISIVAADADGEVIIDGEGKPGTLLVISYGQGPETLIEGLTFRNGNGGSPIPEAPHLLVGGAMLVNEASPVIRNCRFEANSSEYGGAVYARLSEATFEGCDFVSNVATVDGGGLQGSNCAFDILGCAFEGNVSAGLGGGAHLALSIPVGDNLMTVTDCTFHGNHSQIGGGIRFHTTGSDRRLVVTGSSFSSNSAATGTAITAAPAVAGALELGSSTVCCNDLPQIDALDYVDLGGNVICEDDCDGNGIDDSCEIAENPLLDCDGNGELDYCQLHPSVSSPVQSPFGFGSPLTASFVGLPSAAGPVSLTVSVVSDLGSPSEFVTVSLNGVQLAVLFGPDGTDCPAIPEAVTLEVPAATFNDALASGEIVVLVDPSTAVSASQCAASTAQCALEYVSEFVDSDGDGVGDRCDGCPDDPEKIEPGSCGCGIPDEGDSDGDGVLDCVDNCGAASNPDQADGDGDGVGDACDGCPDDPAKVAPGECGCGVPDTDSDSDGTADCDDGCPNDPLKTAPGACGCGVPDLDSDGDGTLDCVDGCPDDPNKVQPGLCGCGVSDIDTDGDDTPDCLDGCPLDFFKTDPGACGCGVPETDSDGDGTPDCVDGCPDDPAKTTPGTCGCGVPDTDSDADGTPDCADECPDDPNKVTAGLCGCGIPDDDSDRDGTPDCLDGCPDDPAKTDPGVCGCGAADTDSDGDGVPDCFDGCPDDPDKVDPGACGCGAPETDSDGDGTPDCVDGCPDDPEKSEPGACGCGVADTDGDEDGVADCVDVCPTVPNPEQGDADGDGTGDDCDGCPLDPLKVEPGECGCGVPDTDSDGDGIPDCNDPFEDCDGDGVDDDNEIGANPLLDCDGDALLDSCSVHVVASPTQSPFGAGAPLLASFRGLAPATSDVTVTVEATSDLSAANEFVTVTLGGTVLGTLFAFDGHDCPDGPDLGELTVPAAAFNAAIARGDLGVTVEASGAVSASQCRESTAKVTLTYAFDFNDCDGDGASDACEIAIGKESDCDANGVPDGCEPDLPDCNGNGVPDACDIAGGAADENRDGIPDECNYAVGDFDLDGHVTGPDLAFLLGAWGSTESFIDLSGDGVVGPEDLAILLGNWG